MHLFKKKKSVLMMGTLQPQKQLKETFEQSLGVVSGGSRPAEDLGRWVTLLSIPGDHFYSVATMRQKIKAVSAQKWARHCK